jgi:hypothetical protein
LYLAFELGEARWLLGFTIGMGQKPPLRSLPARGPPRLQEEIAKAKKRFGLPAGAPVRSCYEAGRDGFWLHRQLAANWSSSSAFGVKPGFVDFRPFSVGLNVLRRTVREADRLLQKGINLRTPHQNVLIVIHVYLFFVLAAGPSE